MKRLALLLTLALGALAASGCSSSTQQDGVTIQRRGLF